MKTSNLILILPANFLPLHSTCILEEGISEAREFVHASAKYFLVAVNIWIRLLTNIKESTEKLPKALVQ